MFHLTSSGQEESYRVMSNDEMEGRLHQIGVVAEWTGLSPEVLRVWERRYGVVKPHRAAGGQRLYTDEDVERLRMLRRATVGGRGIGSVARQPLEEVERLVRADEAARVGRKAETEGRTEGAEPGVDLEEAIALVRSLDGSRLEAFLSRAAALSGAVRFLEGVVAPLMQRIGEEWHGGRLSPAQEHLATGVAQRVVFGVLAELRPSGEAPVFLVAGTAGDRHEMGALLAAAVAAAEGWGVVYLGPDLPAGEVVVAARETGARAVGLSVLYVADPARTIAEVRAVRKLLPASVPLLVGGGASAALDEALEDSGTRVVKDLEGLRAELRGCRPGARARGGVDRG